MSVSLQKANFWKRISAYLFDMMLTVMLAVGIASAISAFVSYDKHVAKLESYYIEYEQTYGVDFDITEEQFNKLSQEELDNFQAAQDALGTDERVLKAYNTMFYLTMAIVGGGLLIGHLILYFVIPLFFKNGQTLGKKVFGVAVMRSNCVKLSNPILFIRSILGLYTIETMVPVLFVLMIYFGSLGIVGVIAIILLFVLQVIVMCSTQTHSSIHDLLADTVVVDFASQQIFDSQEELIAFKQEEHEREVNAMREEALLSAQTQEDEEKIENN